MTSKLWAEIWTRPGDPSYGRVVDDPLEVEGDFHDGLNQIGNGGMQLSNRSPYFDDILVADPDTPANSKSSTVKIFSEKDPTTPIFEWLPNQLFPSTSKNDPLVQVSGVGIKALLGHARLEPYDWDGSDDWACTACDWSFGGTQILSNGGFETVPFPNGGFEDGTDAYWGNTSADGFITNGQAVVAVKDAAASQAGDWYGLVNPGVAMSGAVRSISGLTLGAIYTITGWMLDPTASGDRWRAGVTGASTATHTNAYEEDGYWWAEVGNAAMGAGASTGAWQSFTITFEAAEEQTQLVIVFDDAGSGPNFRIDSWSITGEGVGLYPWNARYPDRTNVFEYQTTVVRSGVGAAEVQGNDQMYTAASGKMGYGRIGIQQPINLNVGSPYVASVWVRQDSGSNQTFQMAIIRESPLGPVGSPGSSYMAADVESIPSGTWTQLKVSFTADVIEANFYVSWQFTGAFDGALHASPTYYVDDALLFEGLPETTVGDMLTQIYNHAIDPDLRSPIVWDDGSASDTPYLTLDFDDTVDSAGNAWDRPEIATKLTMRMSYSQIMAHFARDYDYEYRIVPDDVELGTYLWQVYNPGTMQTDYTTAASPGIQGGAFDVRRNVNRFLPSGTDTMVEGLGRVTARARDTSLMSALGRIEASRLNREAPDLTAAAESASESIDQLLTNSRSLNYILVDPPDEPMSDYVIGDLLVVDDPPEVIASPARFVDVTCSFAPNNTEWEVQFGSARIINPDAAVASAVGGLLAKFEYPFPEPTSLSITPGEGGGTPTITVAPSDSSEWSKNKADFILTGTNDLATMQTAADELTSTGGRLVLTEGNTDFGAGTLTLPGDVHLMGLGRWDNTTISGTSASGIIEVSDDCTISDVTIRQLGCSAGATGIVGAGADNITIRNVRLFTLAVGISHGGDNWIVADVEAGIVATFLASTAGHDNLRIENCGTFGLIDVSDVDHVVITGNRLGSLIEVGTGNSVLIASNTYFDPGGAGTHLLHADGASGLVFAANNILAADGYNGILLENCTQPLIVGNLFGDVTEGIRVDACNGAKIADNLIGAFPGAGVQYVGGTGIWVQDSDDVTVQNNTINQPGQDTDDTFYGIALAGTSADAFVSGNKIIPSAAANQTSSGIAVGVGVTCAVVVSNSLGDPASYGTDALEDFGTNTQLFYPNDATYGDNFTGCGGS